MYACSYLFLKETLSLSKKLRLARVCAYIDEFSSQWSNNNQKLLKHFSFCSIILKQLVLALPLAQLYASSRVDYENYFNVIILAYFLSEGFRGSLRSNGSFLSKTGRYSTNSSTIKHLRQMLKFFSCSQSDPLMHFQPQTYYESAFTFISYIHLLPSLLALLQIHCFESMSFNFQSLHSWL